MKTQNIFSAAACALTLSACVAPVPRLNMNDPQAIAGAIKVEHDSFKKQTNYTGPDISPGGANYIDKYDKIFMRAVKTDAGVMLMYQIYVMDWYKGSWRFYGSAHDDNGVAATIEVQTACRVLLLIVADVFLDDRGLDLCNGLIERGARPHQAHAIGTGPDARLHNQRITVLGNQAFDGFVIVSLRCHRRRETVLAKEPRSLELVIGDGDDLR